MKRHRVLVATGCVVGLLGAGTAWGLAQTSGTDVTCHIDDQNVLSCPLPPPSTVTSTVTQTDTATVTQTDTATVTQTVPGPTTTVPGPTTTVPGPTTTVPGPTTTVPGPTTTVPGPTTTVTTTVTATPTPTPTTTAPPGGFPNAGQAMNATNTGVAGDGIAESSLVSDPTTTYGTAFNGQTISGKLYTHRVDITGSNITIKDCKVLFGGANSFGINIAGSNNTVDHCKIVPSAGKSYYEPVFIGPGIAGAKVTYNDISGGENLLTTYGTNATIQHNYMHDVSTVSDPSGHPDGIEIYGGGPILIDANRIVEGSLFDSPINAAPYSSYTLTGMTVSNNFLDNGQGMILIDNQNNSGFIRNTRILGNAMGGHSNPDTNNSFGIYKALENYDGRAIVQDDTGLAANVNAIEWPTTGSLVNRWEETAPLSPNRNDQVVLPTCPSPC